MNDRQSGAPRAFEVMLKPNGPRCNIDCKYCYYLDKEQYYPDTRKFRMHDAVLERYVPDYIEAQLAAGQHDIVFAWQGGEPTLAGMDFYQRAIALQQQHAPPGVNIRNTLQTNGVLLDKVWCEFFAQNRFLVGISMDGPRQLNDNYRVDRKGRGTFTETLRGLKLLQKHKVEYNVICVLHKHNARRAKELYQFFRKLKVHYLQFIPLIERSSDGVSLSPAPALVDATKPPALMPFSVTPALYGKFLCDVFDLWIKRDVGKMFIQYFDVQLGLWAGDTSSMCWFSEECGGALAMEHNGDLYSCDQYVYPHYSLGNILSTPVKELANSPEQRQFGKDKSQNLPAQCLRCDYKFACQGGCPKHRFLKSDDDEPGLNYLCSAYLKFFTHAGPRLKTMAELVNNGLPAAHIMRID